MRLLAFQGKGKEVRDEETEETTKRTSNNERSTPKFGLLCKERSGKWEHANFPGAGGIRMNRMVQKGRVV
jgi:hypothetical protein